MTFRLSVSVFWLLNVVSLIGSERKDGIFVVRSDADARILKTGARKHELLVTNAVAVSYQIPFPFFPCLVWDQFKFVNCVYWFFVYRQREEPVLRLLPQNLDLGMSLSVFLQLLAVVFPCYGHLSIFFLMRWSFSLFIRIKHRFRYRWKWKHWEECGKLATASSYH